MNDDTENITEPSPDDGWDLHYHNTRDIKGLLVDPARRSISEITIDTETSLDEQLHQLIGADLLDTGQFDGPYIFTQAPWRHLPEKFWVSCYDWNLERFHVWGYGDPFFGEAVLLGIDTTVPWGNLVCCSTRFTPEELSRYIVWMEPRWLLALWTLWFQMPLRFIRRIRFWVTLFKRKKNL